MSAPKLLVIPSLIGAALALAALADPAFDQPMFHGNRERIGWNAVESTLTPSTVSGASFGKLWDTTTFDSFAIDGASYAPHMYAAPLYVDDLSIATPATSGRFSVVIAATSNGYVYAVNAFATAAAPAGAILWSRFLGSPSLGHDGVPVGILSTPAADLSASPPRLYVASDTAEPTRSWRVYALNLSTGATLPGWPIELNHATVEPLNVNGPATFQPTDRISQRGALNLSRDRAILYVPFGSYVDGGTGYLVAIDTGISSGAPALRSAFSGAPWTDASPNAGMWAAAGVAIDSSGYVYATTGNGPPGATPAPRNWSESVLAFNPSLPLSLHGTYTPWNHCQMDDHDVDLAGGGPMLLPDLGAATSTPHLLSVGGKQGNAYLVDVDHLPGRLDQRPDCNLADPVTVPTEKSLIGPDLLPYYGNKPGPLNLFGPYSENYNDIDLGKARSTPAYFKAANGTSYLFFTGSTKTCVSCSEPMPPGLARVKVVTASGQRAYLKLDAYETTLTLRNPGSPIVTSNGSANPIVWLIETNVDRSSPLTTNVAPHATLYAIDAMTMKVLYASAPDQLGTGAKYYHPIVARGIVFVGTDRISAFGLRTPSPPPPATGTLFHDDFARTTGLGSNWTISLGTWVTSNRAESGLDGGDRAAVHNLSCGDCSVSAKVIGFASGIAELDLRVQSSGDRYDLALQPDGRLQVRRRIAGVTTVLAETPSGIPDLGWWATISLTASGSAPVKLTASVNGIAKITVTDSSGAAIGSSGGVGMYSNLAGVWFGSFDVQGASTSTPDAGPLPDAGTPDGGTPDAGSPDAGIPDAGTPDGGTGDGGLPPPSGPLFHDDFNRTTGLGSAWSISEGTWVTSNRAESGLNGSDRAAVRGLSCADCTVSAKVIGFASGIAELGLRVQPTGDRYDVALQPDGRLQIRRHTGATITVLGEAPSGIADLGWWASVSLAASGSSPVKLTASVDGALKVVAIDSSAQAIGATGSAGIWSNLAGVWFGNFDVSGAAAGGSPDAGVPDGGTPDAGAPDAGVPDGGSPDAGTPGQQAILFSDDFQRTIATDLGPSWTVPAGAWRTNNKANSNLNTLDRATVSGITCTNCRIDAKMVNFAGGESMLELRVNGGNRYALVLTASGSLQIRRYAGSTSTVLGSVPSGIAELGLWHSFAFTVSGSGPVTLTGAIEGVVKLTVTDSSSAAYTGSGGAGIAATYAGILFQPFQLTRLP